MKTLILFSILVATASSFAGGESLGVNGKCANIQSRNLKGSAWQKFKDSVKNTTVKKS